MILRVIVQLFPSPTEEEEAEAARLEREGDPGETVMLEPLIEQDFAVEHDAPTAADEELRFKLHEALALTLGLMEKRRIELMGGSRAKKRLWTPKILRPGKR